MRKTKICINAYRIPKYIYITTIKAANEVEIEVLFLLLETCDLPTLNNFLVIYPLKPL